ncbi:zinc finger protein, putative [Ricinus communis]|uniref:Zinc finger protein, putative n=1 Tax=Ricinus communis TaxID=3988 RepID=B9T2L4_RICCO|nr:zinc finger protein, putative [Ricinus communis]
MGDSVPDIWFCLAGLQMGDLPLKSEKSLHEDCKLYVFLMKDGKPICRTQCLNPPAEVPQSWNIHDIIPRSKMNIYDGLPHCFLRPAAENNRDQNEWQRFLSYLQKRNSVGIAKFEFCNFYILPPAEAYNFSHVKVAYREKTSNKYSHQKHCESVVDTTEACQFVGCNLDPVETCGTVPSQSAERFTARKNVHMKASDQGIIEDNETSYVKFSQSIGDPLGHEPTIRHQRRAVKQDGPLMENYVRADPSYLQTLGQAHSGWIFGAIAELVDNSRDAKASRLDILIETIYSKRAGKDIPMLSIIDDGHGMTHQEVMRMTCFGHKQPDVDDLDRIGRFGVGFKTGAMRLGRDALVLTQTSCSRSIAFLSQSLNEGNDNLEIPIVSYRRKGQFMEVDTNVQSEALAKNNLKAIKELSHFDKYLIGEKAGLFHGKHTGTQIYIWNLDEWGSGYCLDWTTGLNGWSSFHQGDILIRSKRVRSRPGQMTQKVPLDYSLRSYLEVIFLVPRMRIYVQGSLVKSRPLAKSLSMTCEATDNILGKRVHLTLGRCQLEWEQGNSGIFLYWHGRLIEAYKRVGGMAHGKVGLGVIGVIDVTDLMDNGNGRVWVHSNKQGFQDCEPYVRLENWLGKKVDEYWDNNFDTVPLKKGGVLYKPDQEWVQCDRCRKWRILCAGYDRKNLLLEWFCYMEPFQGSCETPEQKAKHGVITVSTRRSGYDREDAEDDAIITSEGNSDEDVDQTKKVGKQGFKRIRKGLPRACKKV